MCCFANAVFRHAGRDRATDIAVLAGGKRSYIRHGAAVLSCIASTWRVNLDRGRRGAKQFQTALHIIKRRFRRTVARCRGRAKGFGDVSRYGVHTDGATAANRVRLIITIVAPQSGTSTAKGEPAIPNEEDCETLFRSFVMARSSSLTMA